MLTPDAIPTILPNVAPHLSKHLPPERNVRKRSEEDAVPRKRRWLSTTDEPAVRYRSPSSVSGVLNEPTANDDALATIAALRDVKLPNRYWTFHELREVDGACFTSCSLNASTGEVKVEKAVFFTVNADGGIHLENFCSREIRSRGCCFYDAGRRSGIGPSISTASVQVCGNTR
ncbi:hypothetical protein MRX96_050466 [Rhipicephalus microplus]